MIPQKPVRQTRDHLFFPQSHRLYLTGTCGTAYNKRSLQKALEGVFMKRIRNIVIGGIQNKIFNLILITIILLSAANFAVYQYHSRMLADLSAQSGEQQQAAIEETNNAVMDEVVARTLRRANESEAMLADKLFASAADQVAFMAEYAAGLFASPEDYPRRPYAGPNPADEGEWTAKVIFAEGTDETDPALRDKIGLLANLTDVLITMCRTNGAATAYIALPEGVHFSVSEMSRSWIVGGKTVRYDPRKRDWYREAAAAGELIFTTGGEDALTGRYCLECAAPVYGPDGELAAVAGMDLYLDEMQEIMNEAAQEGERPLLVSDEGKAVLLPQVQDFPIGKEESEGDLRSSSSETLAQIVTEAIGGEETEVLTGTLSDGDYYMTASPIRTTGWVLVSAYSRETVGAPAAMLQEKTAQIQQEASEAYRAKVKGIQRNAAGLLLISALLMLVGAIVLGSRITKPLNAMTKRIAHLGGSNLEFRMEDAFRTGDEVEELATSFADLSHKTVEYMETIKRVTAEKERIGTELTLAKQIQASMLPHIVPAFPDRTDFDIIGSMHAAREVGGDFYDYFLVDDDHLCMMIADVSGKGVPAALFMMASKIILHSFVMRDKSPAQILTQANEAICSDNATDMFVTVWLGILELSTGKLTAANAGHEYPILQHPGGSFAPYRDKHGFVLGGLEGTAYSEYELILEPGTKLFLYTDGVPESADTEYEQFGMERMVDALNGQPAAAVPEEAAAGGQPAAAVPEEAADGQTAAAGETAQDVLRKVRAAVGEFVRGAEQFDDLTMVCLEYKGSCDPCRKGDV